LRCNRLGPASSLLRLPLCCAKSKRQRLLSLVKRRMRPSPPSRGRPASESPPTSNVRQEVQRAERSSKLPRWFFPAMAYASTVAAVWGYSMVACGGLVASAASTLISFCILVFVRPGVGIPVLLVFACSVGVSLALSAHRSFRERRELLFFLLPVASLLIGAAFAISDEVQVTCPSLGPWR
jgi:hypothetical protein